ncbi:hypothetical protein AB4156_41015, partial [Cupriavidus sp. 2MCAB6]|uniref:hypothetical protein n=1 Tax=Cupriavidus sp. 2MCAB6 TaxID=3232981 RepID=UPI003F9147AE
LSDRLASIMKSQLCNYDSEAGLTSRAKHHSGLVLDLEYPAREDPLSADVSNVYWMGPDNGRSWLTLAVLHDHRASNMTVRNGR